MYLYKNGISTPLFSSVIVLDTLSLALKSTHHFQQKNVVRKNV